MIPLEKRNRSVKFSKIIIMGPKGNQDCYAPTTLLRKLYQSEKGQFGVMMTDDDGSRVYCALLEGKGIQGGMPKLPKALAKAIRRMK
jgi:hypothetical protein